MSIIQAMHVEALAGHQMELKVPPIEAAEVGDQPCRSMQIANGPNSSCGPTAPDRPCAS
jgi:hypothetical protein